MNSWLWIPAALLLLAGGRWLWHYFSAVRHVQEAVARLARRDFRTVIFRPSDRLFRRTAHDLRIVSDHLQRQNQLLTEEGFSLRGILSGMVEGVMILDPAQRIRLMNEALANMLGWEDSRVGRPVSEVLVEPDLLRAIGRAIDEGTGRVLEMSLRIPSPSSPELRIFEVSVSALNPGEHRATRGAVVVFHEITKLKNLEATRREFVANVSHEFRTPLAIIQGYVETLREDPDGDPAMTARALEVMHRHCLRLGFLIEDLLTISRLESQDLPLHLQKVVLPEIAQRIVHQLESKIRETHARVAVDFPPDFPAIEADAWRIEQVIFNLLANALRYGSTPDQNPEIKIRGWMENAMVAVEVTDHGPGIPEEDQKHIFERFYRVHKDRSRHAGGTGLGLSIVKNIAVAHGGRVEVHSKPGAGASFRIWLPRLRPRTPLPIANLPDNSPTE